MMYVCLICLSFGGELRCFTVEIIQEGFNPFLSAAYHGSDSVLAAIVFSCPKDDQDMLWASITTQTHRNALHCAVAGNHVHTVAFLLDYAPWSALCVQDIVSHCSRFYRCVYYLMYLSYSTSLAKPHCLLLLRWDLYNPHDFLQLNVDR